MWIECINILLHFLCDALISCGLKFDPLPFCWSADDTIKFSGVYIHFGVPQKFFSFFLHLIRGVIFNCGLQIVVKIESNNVTYIQWAEQKSTRQSNNSIGFFSSQQKRVLSNEDLRCKKIARTTRISLFAKSFFFYSPTTRIMQSNWNLRLQWNEKKQAWIQLQTYCV